jgi:predicted dehydrogenase
MTREPLGIAVVGCGYVADFYGSTLPNHRQLNLVSAYDLRTDRMMSFCDRYGAEPTNGLSDILADPRVSIVVNLTPPHAHDDINYRVVSADKNLYCEKPLGMNAERVAELGAEASRRQVLVAAAPCSILGESAQTLWRALRDGIIGRPRLVYAELENGPLPYLGSDQWTNLRGVPWPTADELAVGCTLEHAPYYLTWLVAMFGRVVSVKSDAYTVLKDQWPAETQMAPDLTVGVLTMESGVICRITCGWVAPPDLSLTVVGTHGTLRVDDAWRYRAPVTLRRRQPANAKQHDYLTAPTLLPLVDTGWPATVASYEDSHDMDVSRGIAELADAVTGLRRLTLDADDHAHVTEVCLMLASGSCGPVRSPQPPKKAAPL